MECLNPGVTASPIQPTDHNTTRPSDKDHDWNRLQASMRRTGVAAHMASEYLNRLRGVTERYNELHRTSKSSGTLKTGIKSSRIPLRLDSSAPKGRGTLKTATKPSQNPLQLDPVQPKQRESNASDPPRAPFRRVRELVHDLEGRRKTLRNLIHSGMSGSNGKATGARDSLYKLDFEPIPIEILNAELTDADIEFAGRFFSEAPKSVYDGLASVECGVCLLPVFYHSGNHQHPLFGNMSEYRRFGNKKNPLIYPCPSCQLKDMFRDVGKNWYGRIEYGYSLPSSVLSCTGYKWGDVLYSLDNFRGLVDPDDLYITTEFFCSVLELRGDILDALQLHQPQMQSRSQHVENMAKLWRHLFSKGYLRYSVDLCSMAAEVVTGKSRFVPSDLEWGTPFEHPEIKFPIMKPFFKRQRITRQCIVCAGDKTEIDYGNWEDWKKDCEGFDGAWTWKILEYPVSHTQRCPHELEICRACIERHISVQVQSGNVENISCPQCARQFSYNEIEMLANEADFKRYDRFLLMKALSKEQNFRWCLGPNCNSGKFCDDPNDNPLITCNECGFHMCAFHQCPWHENQCCAEYTAKLQKEDANNQKAKKLIESSTKACPGCGVRIEKGEGCFHMICRQCGYDFCWECFALWSEVIISKENHREGCYFRTSHYDPSQLNGIDVPAGVREARNWQPWYDRFRRRG